LNELIDKYINKLSKLFRLSVILYIFFLNIIILNGKITYAFDFNATERIIEEKHSAQVVLNPTFEPPINEWNFEIEGDKSDLSYNFSTNSADVLILGESKTFELVSNPPDNSWHKTLNPDFPTYPDIATINQFGCYVSHQWTEEADQSPSVHWVKNITMPNNMSDYIITSANISVIINATVKADGNNPSSEWGLEVPGDATQNGNQYATYDYARFYVLVSDVNFSRKYEVAYYQTVDLGRDSAGEYDYLPNTYLIQVPENALIFYLSDILSLDNYNFSIILGVRLWCEDNWNSDKDEFTALYIKSFNLTFSYTKRIDKFTTGIIKQEIQSIGNETSEIRIDQAFLQFKYKLNNSWPEFLSPNSKIKIMISDRFLNETIELKDASIEYKFGKAPNGFEIKSLLNPYKNFTLYIEIVILDTFTLNYTYLVSIDDVTINMDYVIITRIPLLMSQGGLLLLFLSILMICVLISVIIKQNIIEPRKRRILNALKLKTQVIDDAKNIDGIYLIEKKSKSIRFNLKQDNLKFDEHKLNQLLNDAINFARTKIDLPQSKNIEIQKTNELDPKSFPKKRKIIDESIIPENLDEKLINEFNIANLRILVADSDNFRAILFLKSQASERLYNASKNFVDIIENRFKENPNLNDEEFKKIVVKEIDSIFQLSLLDEYTFMSGLKRRILEKKLGEKGKYLIKIAIKLYYKKLTFILDEILEQIPVENVLYSKSMLLDLIDHQIIIPYQLYQELENQKSQQETKPKEPSLSSDQSLDKTAKWVHSLKKAKELQTIGQKTTSIIKNYNELKKNLGHSHF